MHLSEAKSSCFETINQKHHAPLFLGDFACDFFIQEDAGMSKTNL